MKKHNEKAWSTRLHQVLLVLTDFFNFSRNDVTGQCLRGAEGESSPQSPPAGAFLQKKKKIELLSAISGDVAQDLAK